SRDPADSAAREAPRLSKSDRRRPAEDRGPARRSPGAAPRGSVRLAGARCGNRTNLPIASAGRARANQHLREQLWGSRRARSLRAGVRAASADLRPPELLLLGTAEERTGEPDLAPVETPRRRGPLPLGGESRRALPPVGDGRGEPHNLSLPRSATHDR